MRWKLEFPHKHFSAIHNYVKQQFCCSFPRDVIPPTKMPRRLKGSRCQKMISRFSRRFPRITLRPARRLTTWKCICGRRDPLCTFGFRGATMARHTCTEARWAPWL